MCIAIHKPAGKSIDRETLFSCWCGNAHGAGIAYVKDGALHIVKGLMTFGKFWKAYNDHNINKYQALVHFRLATHGGRDEINTHPFEVTPNLALIHNGIISTLKETDRRMSDTWHFAQFMKHIVKGSADAWKDPKIKHEIELEILHPYNKVAFLHADGTFEIYNRNNWVEDKGVLYSNGGFRWGRSYNVSDDHRTSYSDYYGVRQKRLSDVEFLNQLYREREASLSTNFEARHAAAVAAPYLPRRKRKERELPSISEISMEELMDLGDNDGSTLSGTDSSELTKAANTLLADMLRNEESPSKEAINCEHCYKPQDPGDIKTYNNFPICGKCEKVLREQGFNVAAT